MKHRYRQLACAGAATVGAAVAALVLAGPAASADQCDASIRAQSVVTTAIGSGCDSSGGTAILAQRPGGLAVAATPNEASPPAGPETASPAAQIPEETPSNAPEVPATTPPVESSSPGPEVPETTPPGESSSPAPQVPGAGPQSPGNGSPAPQLPAGVNPQPQLPVTGGHGGEAAALGGTALAAGAFLVLAAGRRRRPARHR